MGSGSFSVQTYSNYATKTASLSREERFSSSANSKMLPNGSLRESRDSEEHPESTAVIIAFDVTGSMGRVPEQIVKSGLGRIMSSLLERNVLPDPQIMAMGVGDDKTDQYPLQVSQFESDMRIVSEIESLYLEGNGGGNNGESYALPWWFASRYTSCDCFEKRGVKGYLFTMGDEPIHKSVNLPYSYGSEEKCLSADQCYADAKEKWNCFHFILGDGGYIYSESRRNTVVSSWREMMGSRAIYVPDSKYLPEIIIATIMLDQGVAIEKVLEEFDCKDILTHVFGAY